MLSSGDTAAGKGAAATHNSAVIATQGMNFIAFSFRPAL
jgi:hypothetical protein